MNNIKSYKVFIKIKEDKIYKFDEYEPIQYNSNIVINQIMEWLRSKLLDNPQVDNITVPLDVFFKECSVDKNKFMTFYNELNKTQKIKNFTIQITNDIITFSDFKYNEENEIKIDENISNKNRGLLLIDNKRFWIGSVNILDGEIEEVHTYETASNEDFHHSFYFSQNQVEKIKNKECMIFWIDQEGIKGDWTNGKIPRHIIFEIKKQIKII